MIRTVADLVAALQKMPQDMPVLVGCHYDNDDGLSDQVSVDMQHVRHSEADYWVWGDPGDPDVIPVVTVS